MLSFRLNVYDFLVVFALISFVQHHPQKCATPEPDTILIKVILL